MADELKEEVKTESPAAEMPKVEVAQEEPKPEVSDPKPEEKSELPSIQKQSDLLGVKADKDIHFELDKSKSVKEQAKDLVDLAATAKAVEDEGLVQDITELKKSELKTSAETSLKEEQVKSKKSEKNLQEANYGIYAGIADLIGLKKPLPNGMLKVLMLILMPLLIAYYVVFGVLTGIINITMDCVNAIVVRFADFTKAARKVIVFVAIVAALAIVFLVIWSILHKYNIL